MTEQTNTATRVIDAPAGTIFNILSNPQRHAETDHSGSVVSADRGDRLGSIGDTFTMNMSKPDGSEYQTRNEVFAFQPDRVIGWKNVENITGGVQVGSKWLYELEPVDADHTSVTLTYDRSELASDAARSVSENYNDDTLAESLGALAAAVTG
ncbi:Polyketide cyclase / dehydrase and lipid transport [Corynebacterium capitovis DSM 44611]|uniref:SRPBCC family protein n=1 Tax=Corynebacterium capitovis TaxID=131081 RepID=UPI0003600EDF|nr:SRPBCC family protein [Corynebacterium capitovis]WKD56752.1 Polyketide cyclase / dehydrase and lipid transport [Corynebacterium capitovis DSM 44611]